MPWKRDTYRRTCHPAVAPLTLPRAKRAGGEGIENSRPFMGIVVARQFNARVSVHRNLNGTVLRYDH